MGWVTGIAIYVVVWWIVVFAVLPWGVRTVDASDIAKGHAAGAPQKPGVLRKMAVTSVVAAIVWLGIFLLVEYSGISLRE